MLCRLETTLDVPDYVSTGKGSQNRILVLLTEIAPESYLADYRRLIHMLYAGSPSGIAISEIHVSLYAMKNSFDASLPHLS